MSTTKTIYKTIIKPILFSQDPSKVHIKMINLGQKLSKNNFLRNLTKTIFNYQHPSLNQTILGIDFKNPVGLSAGFDKDAKLLNIIPSIGFGFTQVGTITNHPYEGNPGKHATRLKKSRALIINYGLKNDGADTILKRVNQTNCDIPISISIGKTNSNKTIELVSGIKDYIECFKKTKEINNVSFYTVNISCPNTFGGEPFTSSKKLDSLLQALNNEGVDKPLFLKMPINLPWEDFKDLTDTALKHKVSGVIIGNLNKNKKDLQIKEKIKKNEPGGISGRPTKKLSNQLIKKTYATYGNKLTIIGVGGISSAEDAYEKIKLGSSLVQLITGMIYEGPSLIKSINKGLVRLLKADGYNSISEAIGAYHKK